MIFYDANVIYNAMSKTIKGMGRDKYASQLYRVNQLLYTVLLQRDLIEGKYKPSKGKKFTLCERGKTRTVTNNATEDKVINHIICDEILTPGLQKFLIHDNSASIKGRGTSFHRRRFEQHLRDFYRKNKSNDGYILLGDFSGYFANINHDICKKILIKFLKRSGIDRDSLNFCWKILCGIFATFDDGVDIGNQVAQNIGAVYPYKFDNFINIKSGIKYYGRYCDDFYVIDASRERLKNLLADLTKIAGEFSIVLNPKKTHITKLSGVFKHLQLRYSLTDTGRLIIKINPKSVTRMRRKLKAFKRLLDAGKITPDKIENIFKSWLCGNYKHMSHRQIFNLTQLFTNLFRRKIQWQKNSRLRYLTAHSLPDWNSTEIIS